MKYPRWCNTKMYIGIYSHTQHTFFYSLITCPLVSTLSIGQHQTITQEHEYVEKLNIRGR